MLAPHLYVPGHGGSSHPLQAGGPDSQEHQEQAGQNQHLLQGGYQVAEDLRGVGAAGRGVRGLRVRDAEPGAAAAVDKHK